MTDPFQRTTLCAGVFGRDPQMLIDTTKILHYCADQFRFKRVLLFSHDEHPLGYAGEWIQTPCIEPRENRDFLLPLIYHVIRGPVLFVHWDGFIVHPELFEPAFLEYDFIGSVWRPPETDMINNGFCWQSEKFVESFCRLPGQDPAHPEATDKWICRKMRPLLEGQGVRFAPRELCERFSLEFDPNGRTSFGFHGKANNPQAFELGWERVNQWLRSGKPKPAVDTSGGKA